MNKFLISFFLIFSNCHTGNLTAIADVPKELDEVSGTETITGSDLIWMMNDSGNSPKVYGVNKKGHIKKELKLKAKNHDWEDLTSDKAGNLYIGDFGNNENNRTDLAILIVKNEELNKTDDIEVARISFRYPDQTKFPPKKKDRHFDCEAVIHFNDSLYLFTKSREKGNFGETHLYKIPATPGDYVAEFINSFSGCNDLHCWVTSADISPDGKTLVLLSLKSVFVFSNFTSDDFFSGTVKHYDLDFESQKEGVCFKDEKTLYITDERANGEGGKLYALKL